MAGHDFSPLISVVVCTHNRMQYLKGCIDSLLQQSLGKEFYEIIVVDNGSTDDTRQFCAQVEENANFRYMYEPILGLSQARNSGWKSARGIYIAYIDDDAEAGYLWLEKIKESFLNAVPEPDCVGGSVTLVWEQSRPGWLTESYFSALGWVDWGNEARYLNPEKEWCVGCNSSYKRATLEDLGGFDTRLGRKKNFLLSGEEMQLHHRIHASGGKFYYHPEARVCHHVAKFRISPSYFYKRYYWGGVTDYIMTKTLENVPMTSACNEEKKGRLRRLATNILHGAGLSSTKNKTVQSRIYMSYVAGWLLASVKFGWRKMDLEKI